MPAFDVFGEKRHSRNTPGHAHFLTFSSFGRRPFLGRARCRQWVVDAVGQTMVRYDLGLWAWVIMPEHIHIILQPRARVYDMGRILQSLKQPVGRRAVAWVKQNAPELLESMADVQPGGGRVYRFWQRGGGVDRNLFSWGEIWEKIDYIHQNPVRRGLIENPTEYAWSSAANFAGKRAGPLEIDFGAIPWRR